MPSYYAEGKVNEPKPQEHKNSLIFSLEGSEFLSYSTFRDALNAQFFSAKRRICILTKNFEDREIAFALFNASRRSLATFVRFDTRQVLGTNSDRLIRLSDELRQVGLTVIEDSLKKLKSPEPTMIAIDDRAWSVSVELSEMQVSAVSVEAAPLTSSEVCAWAQSASSAKAATQP